MALDEDALAEMSAYFTALAARIGRPVGAPAEYDVSIYRHQLPGGMTSTLRRQLREVGLEHRWDEVLAEIPRVREELGWPIMVTPLSQFVGVQAFLNVTTGARYSQIPDEVVKYVLGQYGPPPGELDPGRRRERARLAEGRAVPGEEHRLDLAEARARYGDAISDELLLLRMMLPAEQVDAMLAGPASARAHLPGIRCVTLVEGLDAAPAARDRSDGARPAPARPVSLLTGIDAVVFDVDGTLLHASDPSGRSGAHPIAGAVETVERVRASGRRVLFFTNGTGRPPAQYAADIRSLGFTLADEEFMNPAVVAARWIARRHPGKSVLVLGGPGVVAPLRELGIETIEAAEPALADVVLVGWDDALTYAALRAACESIWAGAPLLATSTASVFSVNGGAAPGWSGAIAAGIRQTTGARPSRSASPRPSRCARPAARSASSRRGRSWSATTSSSRSRWRAGPGRARRSC